MLTNFYPESKGTRRKSEEMSLRLKGRQSFIEQKKKKEKRRFFCGIVIMTITKEAKSKSDALRANLGPLSG